MLQNFIDYVTPDHIKHAMNLWTLGITMVFVLVNFYIRNNSQSVYIVFGSTTHTSNPKTKKKFPIRVELI